ncbi:TniQ family protein [Mycobacterium sp. M1]|uniref:TniQ family protein n=1 Tax=Mycolicibacter acidiphilus TaxID=2835306 RepID=A0ABS5RE36_9MYCO|nr:TniQ family protein [Mycolicibacter acidiphilus]MBS9532545.1 TniQ family protein [Mycolicibacter acidiphilus]
MPAGYDIDRWPVAVAIRPDETIESWLTRAAKRYGITPRELISEAGAQDRLQRPGQLTRLIRQHAGVLALKLGCPEADTIATAAEMAPNAAVVDYLARYRGVTRPIPAGSAFCPVCLAVPDPHWKREWSSMLAIACVRHACLLVRTCPRCGEQPWSTVSWLSLDADAPLYRCPNRPRRPSGRMRRGRRCNFDLRTISPYGMDAEAVDAHRLAFRLWQQYVHDPASLLRVVGIEITATIAFDGLCQLVDESIRIVTLFEDTYDRTALVRALRNAGQVLSSTSATVAAQQADAVGLLNPAGSVTPVGPDNVLLRRRRNPLLAAIRLGSVRATFSPAAQLTFDCGNRHPRYPVRENDDRTWLRLPEHHPELAEIDHAQIPQVLWSGTVWTGAEDATTLAAAAQAMALAKIGNTRPWAIIALDLGLPKGIAVPVTQYWRRVVRDGLWPEALAALTELKEQLRRNPPPIDYQQRRIIADDPRRLVRALKSAGVGGRTCDGREFHGVVRRYWELFTGGDIRYAAPPYTLPAEQHRDWPTKRADIDDDHNETFRNAYALMTAANALPPSGPLTWQPP